MLNYGIICQYMIEDVNRYFRNQLKINYYFVWHVKC
jgi:hypothetical protein